MYKFGDQLLVKFKVSMLACGCISWFNALVQNHHLVRTGCYVEGGDWLRNRFPWSTSLGPYENRTGHLNDVWGYWSTDGEVPLISEIGTRGRPRFKAWLARQVSGLMCVLKDSISIFASASDTDYSQAWHDGTWCVWLLRSAETKNNMQTVAGSIVSLMLNPMGCPEKYCPRSLCALGWGLFRLRGWGRGRGICGVH